MSAIFHGSTVLVCPTNGTLPVHFDGEFSAVEVIQIV